MLREAIGRTGWAVRRVALTALTALAAAGVAVSATAVSAQAPASVRGTVVDDGGSPLPRAEVVVVGSDRRAVTDQAGRFVMSGLPLGRHRLEATLSGYAPALREVDVGAGDPGEVTFALRPTPLSLPGLVVTGAATSGAALDLTRAASQLSGRALERSLGSTVAETLSGQPGLAVRYNGPGASAPVLRGLTGDRVVVMQDGHRSADLAGSAEDHIVTIDPLSAQRIEVIRGPAALLYGNNALGGVVNVLTGGIPAHAPAVRELSAALQVESAYSGATAQAHAAVPLPGPWALGLRLAGRTADDVRVGAAPGLSDRLPDSWLRHGSGAVSVGYGGGRVVGGVTARYFGFGYGVPTPPEDDESLGIDGRLLSASARLEVALDSDLFPSVRIAGSASDYAHDELESGAVEMAFALRTLSLETMVRQAAAGRLDEGAWGASLVARDYVAAGADQLTAPARTWAAGLFTYQQLPVGDAASLQLGLRADRHAITSRADPRFGPGIGRAFTALSGSVGASLTMGRGVTGAVSIARSFRAPTVEELFSDAPHAGTASYEIGDPTLSPETMRGLEAVVRVRTDRIAAEAAAYVSRIDDFITFAARGDTLIDGQSWPVLAYVQHPAAMHGAEGTIDWIARDDVVLGVRGDVVRGQLDRGDAIPFIPPARLGVTARWDPGVLSVGAGARHAFAQRRVSGGPDVETAAYTLLDLDAGVRIARGAETHSLTLRVANATDRHYRDAASRIKRFAPNPGRNISLLYRIHF
jgi:iron complex outermembrane recepter protein